MHSNTSVPPFTPTSKHSSTRITQPSKRSFRTIMPIRSLASYVGLVTFKISTSRSSSVPARRTPLPTPCLDLLFALVIAQRKDPSISHKQYGGIQVRAPMQTAPETPKSPPPAPVTKDLPPLLEDKGKEPDPSDSPLFDELDDDDDGVSHYVQNAISLPPPSSKASRSSSHFFLCFFLF
eukprot:TRINITY_DN2740_c0_g2_i1.p2 TRINITY_DN2740_c0_g2~~TRINITY_DN2740_c0_g2_i1.p2  ORF type:complete len:179 (-),score=25.39 TRINITY_DN2740_c0_g2_i1:124-660(-)